MILHLLLKSLFLSLRGFYLVQHTKLLQFASPFWTNKITGDLASPRFSPIWSFSNRIWACKPPIAWEVESTSSTLKFQITLILSELNSDILVVAPLLQLNPSPTVALHQNGLVWSCIRATTIQTKLIEKAEHSAINMRARGISDDKKLSRGEASNYTEPKSTALLGAKRWRLEATWHS